MVSTWISYTGTKAGGEVCVPIWAASGGTSTWMGLMAYMSHDLFYTSNTCTQVLKGYVKNWSIKHHWLVLENKTLSVEWGIISRGGKVNIQRILQSTGAWCLNHSSRPERRPLSGWARRRLCPLEATWRSTRGNVALNHCPWPLGSLQSLGKHQPTPCSSPQWDCYSHLLTQNPDALQSRTKHPHFFVTQKYKVGERLSHPHSMS